jgi:ATP-dependent DNA ligase
MPDSSGEGGRDRGHDWTERYPLIVEALKALEVQSCLIDGEAVACDDDGKAVFKRLRQKRHGRHIFLYAFALLELNGQDLKREPLEERKAALIACWTMRCPACNSTATSLIPATPYSAMRASLASRGSSASAWDRVTDPAAHAIGSSSRTRMRRP